MFLVAVAFLFTVTADDVSNTKCPQVNSAHNFNISQIGTGRLFEVARYVEDHVEKTGDCAIGDYKLHGDTSNFEISSIENKKKFVVRGLLRYDNYTQKLIYTFYEKGKVLFEVKLNIVYTDHKNLFMIYNCNYDDAANTKHEVFWILSRSQNPHREVQDHINKFFKSHSFIDPNKLKWSNFSHESCEVSE